MASKRLVLLRHAKSSWDDSDLVDFDRPLAPRGRRAATRMGRYLAERKLRPEVVLCSSAVRTRQTLERLDLPGRTRVEFDDELYASPPSVLLDRVRRVEGGVGEVMVIAHNPGLHDLVAALLEDPSAAPSEFPTAALAVLGVPIERWSELAPGVAQLELFTVPRSLG